MRKRSRRSRREENSFHLSTPFSREELIKRVSLSFFLINLSIYLARGELSRTTISLAHFFLKNWPWPTKLKINFSFFRLHFQFHFSMKVLKWEREHSALGADSGWPDITHTHERESTDISLHYIFACNYYYCSDSSNSSGRGVECE